MTFSPSGFSDNLTQLGNTLNVIPPRLQDYVNGLTVVPVFLAPVPGILYDLSGDGTGAQIIQKGKEFVTKVGDYLQDLLELPFVLWNKKGEWESITTTLTNIETDLKLQIQDYGQEWTGIAGGKYNAGVSNQPLAVSYLASVTAQLGLTCQNVADQTAYFLVDLINLADIVYESPDELNPGAVLNAITGAVRGAGTAYLKFHTTLDSYNEALSQAVHIAHGNYWGGNWPLAARP